MEERVPRIEVRRKGEITIVDLLDEEVLEEHVINEIAESLFAVLDGSDSVNMVLSFANVKHLSSSALGVLIRLSKHVQEKQGTLKLCDIESTLYEVFVITKLNNIFAIYESEKAALASFK